MDASENIDMKTTILSVLISFLSGSLIAQRLPTPKIYTLQSPDGKLRAIVSITEIVTYTVVHEADTILPASPISMELDNGQSPGIQPVLKTIRRTSVDRQVFSPLYKRSQIKDNYNEFDFVFKDEYRIVFRAYNEGIAYRFATTRKKDFKVLNEQVVFNFNANLSATVSYVNKSKTVPVTEQFFNSFENVYSRFPITLLHSNRVIMLPMMVEIKGKKVCITEADLESYPGMYLVKPENEKLLKAIFAPYPKETSVGGHNGLQLLVTQQEHYIAKVKGTRAFPWRVLAISSEDIQFADNDLVYKLAAPSRIRNIDWVKPGKVAWDWWNDWNIKGVDFTSGVNNDTYKYYIDFAGQNNVSYVILDEGWSVNKKADLMQVVPEVDLKELVRYAADRKVGLILWAGYYALDRDMENVFRYYADLGVKGFKVDFMDRDDQQMVDFYYRCAEIAAKYRLIIDFHGAYKPTGLNRTYPNVLNVEGVHGLENMKWVTDTIDQVTYDVTIPFIRMLAGPMDYTQGAMRNSIKSNYYPIWSDPMSQGTRCRQLAQYIIYEAPLAMLCDNPSSYIKEKACTAFIISVPETWDETIAINGEVGKYISMARKKGNQWYLGSLTNWDKRELVIDLSFLGEGAFKMEIFRDGTNADKNASDFKQETIDVPANRKFTIRMAPGGGFAARIFKS